MARTVFLGWRTLKTWEILKFQRKLLIYARLLCMRAEMICYMEKAGGVGFIHWADRGLYANSHFHQERWRSTCAGLVLVVVVEPSYIPSTSLLLSSPALCRYCWFSIGSSRNCCWCICSIIARVWATAAFASVIYSCARKSVVHEASISTQDPQHTQQILLVDDSSLLYFFSTSSSSILILYCIPAKFPICMIRWIQLCMYRNQRL